MTRPRVRLPVSAGAGQFELGVGPGYYRLAGSSDRLWWDGQDIWLAPGADDLFAVARGTVRFVPAGQRPDLPEPVDDDATATNDLLPGVGDALVLELWPTVVSALEGLLPDDAFLPARIVYQNVDREDAATRIGEIIMADPDAHRGFFQEPGEAAIDDTVLATRVRTWIRDHWLDGDAPGVLVDPTTAAVRIGRAIAPPAAPDALPDDARAETPVPPGASGWSRLTLKAVTEDGKPANPLFWLHLIARVESDEWTERPRASDDDVVLTACLRAVGELRTVRVSHQLDAGWEIGMTPREDMPPALGSLRLHVQQPGDSRRLIALLDPTATGGYWRLQGPVEDATPYECLFDGAELYAQVGPPSLGSLTFGSHDAPHRGLATRRWFDFGSGPRFILGMNLPTLRRKNGHDLGPNDIRRTMTGNAGYGLAWLSEPGHEIARKRAIESDLDNIRAMGVRALRVWAFEQLEGLRFGFTNPGLQFGGQTLLEEIVQRQRRDIGGHIYSPITRTDMETEFDAWRALPHGMSALPLAGASDHPLQILIDNAIWLSNAAGARGMRILWCLYTHYGEGSLANDWHWTHWFAHSATAADELPVDAWVFRAVLADRDLRDSVIANAVRPFIAAVEDRARCPDEPLGYEIINEVDNIWEGCVHGWSTDIHNGGSSRFLLTDAEARAFISAVGTAVRSQAPATRLLTVSQQGSYYGSGSPRLSVADEFEYHLATDPAERARWRERFRRGRTEYMNHVRTELGLIEPAFPLSCNAISRYAGDPTSRGGWYWRYSSYLPDLRDPALDPLLAGDRLLLSEAGGNNNAPSPHTMADCDIHARTVREIPRRAMRRGYAGAFLWQYGDPERLADGPHPYTERASQTPAHNHPNPLFAGARPAAREIATFANLYDRLLMPRARP